MGNVAEPSTRHTLTEDIYTHITYADLRTEEERGSDEWKNAIELEMNIGDSHFLYEKYQITLDTLVVDAKNSQNSLEYAALGAGLTITTTNDSTYQVMPIFLVEGNQARKLDVEIKELGLKFSFDRINYDTDKPVIIASQHTEAEVPFILVKAEVFPWINLLWLGSILMAVGTGIAIVQRIKRERN